MGVLLSNGDVLVRVPAIDVDTHQTVPEGGGPIFS
jgi:hypothetical protein